MWLTLPHEKIPFIFSKMIFPCIVEGDVDVLNVAPEIVFRIPFFKKSDAK